MTHKQLDSTTANRLRKIKQVILQWELGCPCADDPETGDKLPPEACYECTEGALVEIEALLK